MITRLNSVLGAVAILSATQSFADGHSNPVSDDNIAAQRAKLAAAVAAGFGPQAPRDIDSVAGTNGRLFEAAPVHSEMNLCNIHFHEGAEHKGGQFTTYRGNGDGAGTGTGYAYDGELTEAELAPYANPVGAGKFGSLEPGDTIEIHFVHSSAQVKPGPTLGSCLSESIMNPQLRVEGQVYVLVNDPSAADLTEIAKVGEANGYAQAVNMPTDLGTPVLYAGSTTGPGYNEKGSPLQVTWSVHPNVKKVSIQSVEAWLGGNMFDEKYAHGVRNLVVNPELLSQIN